MKKISHGLIILLLFSCGTPEIVRSKAVCSVEKHVQDDIYQVKINGKAVNNRWYLEDDANEIKVILAARNNCMR